MENLQQLFDEAIMDLHSAEKQFLEAMPKLVEAAESQNLKAAIEDHIAQTEGHVQRLEIIAKLGGFRPNGEVCKAAEGLVEEAEEHIGGEDPGPTLDAAIIACAQKNEHYEIGSYGTAIAWASLLGNEEAVDLLKETMDEEKAADQALTEVAQEVNEAALVGAWS